MSDLTRSAVTDISVVEITSARHKTKAVPPRDFYALSYRYAGEISIVANGKRADLTEVLIIRFAEKVG